MSKYLGCFTNKRDVEDDFCLGRNYLDDVNILLAWYGQADYDGSAFVLFEQNGKLYEVNGSHCSCYGLEDQWEPEETLVEALVHRIKEGHLGRDGYYDEGLFGDQLLEILNQS
jgi:hypothetical protein